MNHIATQAVRKGGTLLSIRRTFQMMSSTFHTPHTTRQLLQPLLSCGQVQNSGPSQYLQASRAVISSQIKLFCSSNPIHILHLEWHYSYKWWYREILELKRTWKRKYVWQEHHTPNNKPRHKHYSKNAEQIEYRPLLKNSGYHTNSVKKFGGIFMRNKNVNPISNFIESPLFLQ